MTEKASRNDFPEEVTLLLHQFLRDMARLHIGVFGLVYVVEPKPSMALLRTSSSDPIVQAKTMTRLITSAVQDGRIEAQDIGELN